MEKVDTIELEARVRHLENIINAGPTIAFVWDLSHGWPVTFISESIAEFGYSTDDFLSGRLKYAEIVHPEDLERVEAEVKNYTDSGQDRFYQRYRIKTAAGTTRWVSDWTRIFPADQTGTQFAQGVIVDITDNVMLEERAQRYLRIAGNLFIALDSTGKVTALNDLTLKITAARREDVLGQNWFDNFIPEDKREEALAIFDEIIHSPDAESTGEIENEILTLDGRRRAIHWFYSLDLDADGHFSGVIAFGADITEQRLAERRAQDLSSFPGQNPSPVLRIDGSGDVLVANAAANAMLESLSNSGDRESLAVWRRLIDHAKSATEVTQEQIVVDGQVFIFNLVPLPDEGYTNLYAVDATEQIKATNAFKETLKKTVYALSAVLEARDPYTAGHEHEVARIAGLIGREMELTSDQLEGLELAATVHDVGKIRVPAEILSKPAKLTDAEYEIIKEHSLVGASFLRGIDFEWPIADIVEQHHERFDGSGYPHGIAGEDILLEARIIGVADTLEAMASHRPYRAGLGIEKASEEIRTGAGTRYDPAVAAVCLNLIESGKLVL